MSLARSLGGSWKLVGGLATTVLGLLSPWLVSLSDTLWWQLVPWALLALFWAGVAVHVRRQRRDAALKGAGVGLDAPAS